MILMMWYVHLGVLKFKFKLVNGLEPTKTQLANNISFFLQKFFSIFFIGFDQSLNLKDIYRQVDMWTCQLHSRAAQTQSSSIQPYPNQP